MGFKLKKLKFGGSLGKVFGGITGGLIGEDPNKHAKREAKRQKEEAKRLVKEKEEQIAREEEYNKNIKQDTEVLANTQFEETRKGKPVTSVDFSNSVKGFKSDETEEDKLKKAFRRR